MASTKRRSLALFIGVVVLCSAALAADEGSSSYPGQIGMYNPCNNGVVIVDGTNHVRVHENAREHDEAHVTIHLRFLGSGEDQVGMPYRTVLIAKGQFDTAAASYDLPYRSVWIGQKGSPSFSMKGTLRVWVDSGVAKADNIMTYETSCMKDLRPEDRDKDFDDDHDLGSHADHDRGSRDDHDRGSRDDRDRD